MELEWKLERELEGVVESADEERWMKRKRTSWTS